MVTNATTSTHHVRFLILKNLNQPQVKPVNIGPNHIPFIASAINDNIMASIAPPMWIDVVKFLSLNRVAAPANIKELPAKKYNMLPGS